MIIRHETSADERAVENLTREAFWNIYQPGCMEHYLVHLMRSHPDYLPDLSFVLESEGEIVGSIHYTRSRIVQPDGAELATVSFGPVGILPAHQGRGLGRTLITHSIDAARQAGHRAILITGDWRHYTRYGFRGAKVYGISMPDGKFYTCCLALPLREGALAGAEGRLLFSPVYEASEAVAPETLAAFDARFPPKEKRVLPCQAEFIAAASEIDVS